MTHYRYCLLRELLWFSLPLLLGYSPSPSLPLLLLPSLLFPRWVANTLYRRADQRRFITPQKVWTLSSSPSRSCLFLSLRVPPCVSLPACFPLRVSPYVSPLRSSFVVSLLRSSPAFLPCAELLSLVLSLIPPLTLSLSPSPSHPLPLTPSHPLPSPLSPLFTPLYPFSPTRQDQVRATPTTRVHQATNGRTMVMTKGKPRQVEERARREEGEEEEEGWWREWLGWREWLEREGGGEAKGEGGGEVGDEDVGAWMLETASGGPPLYSMINLYLF